MEATRPRWTFTAKIRVRHGFAGLAEIDSKLSRLERLSSAHILSDRFNRSIHESEFRILSHPEHSTGGRIVRRELRLPIGKIFPSLGGKKLVSGLKEL
jgi:hypothetical protein